MLERTKKLPTDAVVLSFTVPSSRVDEVVRMMRNHGIEREQETYDFRTEVFTGSHADLKASALRGLRYREGLTQVQLAEKTGIQRRHISAYENGRIPMGKQVAQKLAHVLNADYRIFL